MQGFVYTLHFSRPYEHARHYTGWALDPERRVAEHLSGNGKASPLVRAALADGIEVTVAYIRPGDRFLERRIKNQGGASRRCPLCKAERGAA